MGKRSGYKNIYFNMRMNMWYGKVVIRGVVYNLGYYELERDALLAYDRFAIRNGMPTYILKKKE